MEPPAPLDPLIAKHQADITALRAAVGPLPTYWDDIWLLRYCLSFPDVEERQAAVKTCVAYREKNSAMLADVAAGRPAPHEIAIRLHMTQGFHGASIYGEPLYIVRAGISSAKGLMDSVPAADVLDWFMYYKEASFLRCDAETRARRTLVKMVSVIDMAHASLSDSDRRFFAILGESGKLSETAYPQMQARNVMLHPPSFMYAMFSIVKVFMSKKQLDKQAICPGGAGVPMSAKGCPYASKRFDVAALPSFTGGACHCTAAGGCICGVPNEESRPHGAATLRPEGSPQPVTVPARSHFDLLLPARAPGAVLSWSLAIEEKGLEVEAWVTPHEPAGAAPVTVLARRKHAASEGSIAGTVPVLIAGTVTLRLDNAHSMLTAKRATVSARVDAAAKAASAAAPPPSSSSVGGSASTEGSVTDASELAEALSAVSLAAAAPQTASA